MEAIFEIIFQIIFEVVFEVIAQILVELGFEGGAKYLRSSIRNNPIFGGIFYFSFGLILGGLSLLIFPEPIVKSPLIKMFNFVFSPVLIGFSLCFTNWILKGRKEEFFQLDKFIFGILFALSYSFIRFMFTN